MVWRLLTRYLSNSFFNLFLRSFFHFIHLTPKPLFPQVNHKPSLFALAGPSIFITLSHAIFAPPTGSPASHGYLHGSLIIDFVGQSAPRTRFQLLGLDLLVIILQLVMFGASVRGSRLRRRKAKSGRHDGTSTTGTAAGPAVASDLAALGVSLSTATGATRSANAAGATAAPDDPDSEDEPAPPLPTGPRIDLATDRRRPRQDLDAEERGVRRRSSTASSRPSVQGLLAGEQEDTWDGAEAAAAAKRDEDPLAAHASGQAVVLELDIPRVVRRQWRQAQRSAMERRMGRRLGSF
jgi:hypothetical protein